jgi:tripartite-type tricarboxylate transporter receptor subunit TctC
MDPKIVAKIHDAFRKALDEPASQAMLAKFDMTVSYKNTDDYRNYISEAIRSEREILEGLGLTRKD